MPQTCSVCKHPEKLAIEDALLRKVPMSRIARQTKTGLWSINRHKKHMAAGVVRAAPYEVSQTLSAVSLLNRVESLLAECRGIADAAKRNKSWAAAVSALREVRGCIELLGKLDGQLKAAGELHLHQHQHLHVEAPRTVEELDLEIARNVGEATSGFELEEFLRLKQLVQGDVPALQA